MMLLSLILLPIYAFNTTTSNYTGTVTGAATGAVSRSITGTGVITAAAATETGTGASMKPTAITALTVSGQPSIFGQVSQSAQFSATGRPSMTVTVSFCYETRSYSNYVTPSPVQGPAIVSSYQPLQEQQSFIIGVAVGGGIIVFIIILMLMEVLLKPNKKVLTTTNPMTLHTDYVIENGKNYYYDKANGRLLAEGWKKFQDGDDVWYSNGQRSSWQPVYK